MRILFVINNEVARRAVQPILDQMAMLGTECSLLVNPFSMYYMKGVKAVFVKIQDARIKKWDFIVSANPVKRDEFQGQRIILHHGSMFGNSAWSLNGAYHSDLYIGLSEYELSYIKKHLKDKFADSKFKAAGNPANDGLFEYRHFDDVQKLNLKKSLGLKDMPVILLSSHWTSMGNLRRFGTGLLDALAWNFPEYQIVCVFHPSLMKNPKSEFLINKMVKTPYFDFGWMRASLHAHAKRNENIKIMDSMSTPAKLLAVSDVFIGDNSSFLAEAAYFDLPLVANLDEAYFDTTVQKIVQSSVHRFHNIESLLGHVNLITRDPSATIKRGQNIKKLFMHNVGSATDTIVRTMTQQ